MAIGGTIVLTESTTTPDTPTTDRVRIFADANGILNSVDDAGVVTTYAAGITPEQVQDIVGAMLQDTSTVNATYDDAGNVIFFDVIAGGVNHNALLNYVALEHVNHSSVNITAGTGLSGGGDISASRTLSIADTGVTAATYGSTTQVPQIAVNAQGQITSASNVTITPANIGAQPADSDLTAVSNLAGTGFISRTGTGTATTRTNTAGTGITVTNGDGVSGNPTYAISNTGVTAATYGSATQVPQVAINAQGQATSAANVNIAIPLSQITQSGATVNQVPQWNGSAWVPATGTVDISGKANLAGGNTFTGAQIFSDAVTVNSTTNGFLPPRVTSSQRAAVTGAAGSSVFDTTLQAPYVYIGGSINDWHGIPIFRRRTFNLADSASSTLVIGDFEFRYSATGIGGNLQIRALTVTKTVNWYGIILTTAFAGSGGARNDILASGFTSLTAGVTYSNNAKGTYDIHDITTQKLYKVSAVLDNNATFTIVAELI